MIVIVLILSNQFCFSQNTDKNFIKDFALLIDTSGTPEFDSILPVGFTFQTENGKTKNIESFTNEYAEAFDIHTENCKLINGFIHYDVNEVYKNGHKLKCEIAPKNNPSFKKSFLISIPYLLSFNIYYDTKIIAKPGTRIPLNIEATFSNKKIYTSEQKNENGLLNINNFSLSVFNKPLSNANIAIPDIPENFHEFIPVFAKYKLDTLLTNNLNISLDYNSTYTLHFNGKNGMNGKKGLNGVGNEDYNGIDGQNGEDGLKGENGKDIKIIIKSIINNKDTLLKILVLTDSSIYRFILNTKEGRLIIHCKGGNGGDGGKGGNGSDGFDVTSNHNAGHGGNAGNGGYGGEGGNGGMVITYSDSIAYKFLDIILLQNKGGKGGIGGIGGKGGKGGYQDCGSEACNTNGYNGAQGINGAYGYSPEPFNYILPKSHIDELFEIHKKKKPL